jgi:hypothetical protein
LKLKTATRHDLAIDFRSISVNLLTLMGKRNAPMKIAPVASVLPAIAFAGAASAQIETAPPLPLDAPQAMRSMEAVCTGVGSDSRDDPRWAQYPLRVEVVGIQGQYLGEVRVTLIEGNEAIVSVRCGGPWVLFRIAPGTYGVTAEVGGASKSAKVTVDGKTQARVIIRFPDQGGAVSPEFKPATK